MYTPKNSRAIDNLAIKAKREAAGYSMEEAARLVGMKSRQHWYKLEKQSKDCAASTLRRVARLLKCRMEDLMLPDATKPAAKPKPEP